MGKSRLSIRKTKRAGILLLWICGFARIQAQQAFHWSLDSLMNAVERANPVVHMYDADARSMDEAAKGAYSWMPPDISAGMWMTPDNPGRWVTNSQGIPGMGQFMISAQQLLPNRRKQDARFNWMRGMSTVVREQKGAALNKLRSDTKRHYYAWLVLKRKKEVLRRNEELLRYMQQSAEIRLQYGKDKLGAYYKVQAALGRLHNMNLMLDAETDQHRIALNTLMNRNKLEAFDIDTVYTLKTWIPAEPDTAAIRAARSDLRVIDQDIRLNELKIKDEQAQLLPEYGIRMDQMIGWARQPLQFNLMGMIRIPFASWSRKMTDANMESLRWKKEALRSKQNMTLNEAAGMVASIHSEILWKQQQLKGYETEILPALRKNYQSLQLGFEQNNEELFMLYDAWDTLNMTQLEYFDRLGELLQLQTGLEDALEIR